MNSLTGNKITIRGWFAQGLRIIIRHWPLFTIGALAILALEFLFILITPQYSPLVWCPEGMGGAATAYPIAVILIGIAIQLILLPLLRLGFLAMVVEVDIAGSSSLGTLMRPFRRPVPVLVAMTHRALTIGLGLIVLVPGILSWIRLSFSPLLVLREDVETSSRAMEVSRIWIEGHSGKILMLRGACTLVMLPILWIASASFALAGSALGMVAVAVIQNLLSVVWMSALGAAYANLGQSTPFAVERIQNPTVSTQLTEHPGSGMRASKAAFLRAAFAILLLLGLAAVATWRIDRLLFPDLLDPVASVAKYDPYSADARLAYPEVRVVEFFSDSSYVAIGTTHGIEIRSIPSLELLKVITLPKSEMDAMAISPSGGKIAYSDDGWLYLVDVASERLDWTLQTEHEATALAFDPTSALLLCGYEASLMLDTRFVISGAVASTVNLGKLTRKDNWRSNVLCPSYVHEWRGRVSSVEWGTDARQALAHLCFGGTAGCERGLTIVWDVPAGDISAAYCSQFASFTDHAGLIAFEEGYENPATEEIFAIQRRAELPGYGIAWCRASLDHRRIVYPYDDGVVVQSLNGAWYRKISLGYPRPVDTPVSFLFLGMRIALPGFPLQNAVRWSESFVGLPKIAVSQDVRWMLAWSLGRIRLWDLSDASLQIDLISPYDISLSSLVQSQDISLMLLDYAWGRPDLAVSEAAAGNMLGMISIDAYQHLEDRCCGELIMSRDGSLCAVADDVGLISVWCVDEWHRPLHTLQFTPGDKLSSESLGFSGDSSAIFVWTGDVVLEWGFGLDPIPILRLDNPETVSLRGSAMGVLTSDGSLAVWDLETRTKTDVAAIPTERTWIHVEESGNAVAVVTADGELYVYTLPDLDMRSMEPNVDGLLVQNAIHPGEKDEWYRVEDVAFINDGEYLAGIIECEKAENLRTWDRSEPSRYNGIGVVWDVGTGEQVFASLAGRFRSIYYSPAVGGIAMSTFDNDILFFKVPELAGEVD